MEIDEKERTTLLLCSMLESWNTLIINISKDIDLTYESKESMLLVKESQRKTNGGGSSKDTKLVACSRFKGRDCGCNDQDRFESRGKNKGKC